MYERHDQSSLGWDKLTLEVEGPRGAVGEQSRRHVLSRRGGSLRALNGTLIWLATVNTSCVLSSAVRMGRSLNHCRSDAASPLLKSLL